MQKHILKLLACTTISHIETLLNNTFAELELEETVGTYRQRAEQYEIAIQKSRDYSDIVDYQLMCALLTVAHYKTQSLPQAANAEKDIEGVLDETKRIGDIILDQALHSVESQFGPNYAMKNPHVFGNVLQVFRTAYISMQEKK